jgi:amino acid permease
VKETKNEKMSQIELTTYCHDLHCFVIHICFLLIILMSFVFIYNRRQFVRRVFNSYKTLYINKWMHYEYCIDSREWHLSMRQNLSLNSSNKSICRQKLVHFWLVRRWMASRMTKDYLSCPTSKLKVKNKCVRVCFLRSIMIRWIEKDMRKNIDDWRQ